MDDGAKWDLLRFAEELFEDIGAPRVSSMNSTPFRSARDGEENGRVLSEVPDKNRHHFVCAIFPQAPQRASGGRRTATNDVIVFRLGSY